MEVTWKKELAVRRKAFEKQEKQFANQKKLHKRVLAANVTSSAWAQKTAPTSIASTQC